ncbi:MAG: hypothetical protein WKG07_02505 [Hymenobacter sp.]
MHDVLRTYLWELLHLVQKLQPATTPAPLAAAGRLATRFGELLERQFPLHSPRQPLGLRTPADYADHLAVHVNYLNRALKAATGHTTTALIGGGSRRKPKSCCGIPPGASRKLPTCWALPTRPISGPFSSAKQP